MQLMPTRIHGFVDYAMGILLIISPWILGFARGGAETWVPVLLGLGVIVYSLFTKYELGVVPAIDMPAHLALDAVGGAALAISPWVFGFAPFVWAPHLILGLLEIGAAAFTEQVPMQAPARRPVP